MNEVFMTSGSVPKEQNVRILGGASSSGGTEYTEGDVQAAIVGTAILGEAPGNTLAPVALDASNNVKVAVQGTVPVSGTFYQATQPVSIASAVSVTDNGGTLSIDDGAGSITVDGTVAISNASIPVTDNGTTLSIDDGAGSITVDGTVAISNSSIPVTDNAGSLTVDAPVATPVFVRLSDGAAAITTLPVSLASVPSHNVTNAGTFAVQSTNQANSGVDIGDVTINNASGASAVNIQDGGNSITVDGTVAVSGTVTTKETRASSPAQTSPSVTSSSTSILASNANRLGATIYNEGSAICYMKLGSTASTTSYTLQIASGGYYEVPFNYTGAIDGITSSGTAQLRVTEIT